MIRLYVTADTHNRKMPNFYSPKCDIILHCGDITNYGIYDPKHGEVQKYYKSVSSLKPLFYVRGNHDLHLTLSGKNCYRLDDKKEVVTLPNGLRLCGASMVNFRWNPWLKIFNCNSTIDDDKDNEYYHNLPECDILISHSPPYGTLLDTSPHDLKKPHKGSKGLRNYILREQPKYVFCGHIHRGLKPSAIKMGETTVINVAETSKYILV